MANTFIKATQIVDAANYLLRRELVLARFITTYADSNFVGAFNDTVTMRVPAVLPSRTRVLRSATALVADDLTETSLAVTLDTHVYQLLNITDEQLTLDIRDFSAQVLQPQMRAVAEGVDTAIATELAGVTPTAAVVAVTTGSVYDGFVDAQKALNDANVPRGDRIAVVGSRVEARIVKEIGARQTSLGDSAVQDATVGQLAGLTVIGSNAVPTGTAYIFHRTAIVGGFVAPALPSGASMAARASYEGLALRYLRDYNPTNSTGPVDRSLVDLFMGTNSVNDGAATTNQRLVKLTAT